MTVKRLTNLAATLAAIALAPGAAPPAMADAETAANSADDTQALVTAADRQRRVESAWLAEQRLAAHRQRR